jgi:hypothetical protein
MSIPIGTKMLTKPPKQKSKTHLKNHTFRKKKNLHKTLLISTMNNDLCISQTYSNDNVKTSRLHDTHILSWTRVKLIQGKVTRTKTFINLMSQWFRKIAVLRLNFYLFEWFVIIECERTDKYKIYSPKNYLRVIH